MKRIWKGARHAAHYTLGAVLVMVHLLVAGRSEALPSHLRPAS